MGENVPAMVSMPGPLRSSIGSSTLLGQLWILIVTLRFGNNQVRCEIAEILGVEVTWSFTLYMIFSTHSDGWNQYRWRCPNLSRGDPVKWPELQPSLPTISRETLALSDSIHCMWWVRHRTQLLHLHRRTVEEDPHFIHLSKEPCVLGFPNRHNSSWRSAFRTDNRTTLRKWHDHHR